MIGSKIKKKSKTDSRKIPEVQRNFAAFAGIRSEAAAGGQPSENA